MPGEFPSGNTRINGPPRAVDRGPHQVPDGFPASQNFPENRTKHRYFHQMVFPKRADSAIFPQINLPVPTAPPRITLRGSMHILQIISGREVNGAVTYVRFLTEQLLAAGHQVSILHRHRSWIGRRKVAGTRYFHSELNRTPRELFRIAKLVRQQKIDLVHTHMSRAHFFGVLLKYAARIPVVATAHSCTFQLHWMFNDFVIANSRSTLEFQRRFNRVSARRSDTIYCFTNLKRFGQVPPGRRQEVRSQLRVAPDDFLIGVVGQIGPRKGQQYLLQCLPELMERIPGIKVALVGEYWKIWPYVRRMRAFQMRHRLFGRIRWLGRRGSIENYMNAFDLCVVPSVREPLGLVALESLAAGTPVVATDTGGLPEIIDHEYNGLLVPRRDTRQLTDAIIRLANDPRERQRMGQRGKAMVDQQFHPEVLTGQVLEVYRRVLAAGGVPMPETNPGGSNAASTLRRPDEASSRRAA